MVVSQIRIAIARIEISKVGIMVGIHFIALYQIRSKEQDQDRRLIIAFKLIILRIP